jgi:hypothetical protein
MKIISLGSSCSISHNLQLLNKREESLPFDWIKSSRLSSINLMIRTDFTKLWDKTEYKLKKESDKFFIQNDKLENNYTDVNIYYHQTYLINFYHDFEKSIDFNISFDKFKVKYKRRVNRFFNLIINSKEILFIREQINPKHIKIEDIKEFIKLIKNLNPNLEFKLLIILNNYLEKDVIDYQSPHLDIIIEKSKLSSWQRVEVLKPIILNYL